MAWYRTGTVAVTNNSNVVTGTGTSWVDGASIGETFLGPDAQVYEITSIVSGTSCRRQCHLHRQFSRGRGSRHQRRFANSGGWWHAIPVRNEHRRHEVIQLHLLG